MRKEISILLLLLVPILSFSQDRIIEDMNAIIRSGYADGITKHLNGTIKLSILNKDYNVTSKDAIASLNSFFKKNKPLSYEVMHKGENNNSIFIIGKLKTTNNTYRVSYLIKDNIIQQIRIEN